MKTTGVRCQRLNNLRFRGRDSCFGGKFITLCRQERKVHNEGVPFVDTPYLPGEQQECISDAARDKSVNNSLRRLNGETRQQSTR
jgi:hypothetical protein